MRKQPPTLFTKFYPAGIQRIRRLASAPPTAMNLWLLLVEQASKTNVLEASYDTLAEVLNTDRKTVMRTVNYLEETGAVEVYRHKTGNVYVLNNDETWKDAEDHKHYAAYTSRKLVGKDNPKLRALVATKARNAQAARVARDTVPTDTRLSDLEPHLWGESHG